MSRYKYLACFAIAIVELKILMHVIAKNDWQYVSDCRVKKTSAAIKDFGDFASKKLENLR